MCNLYRIPVYHSLDSSPPAIVSPWLSVAVELVQALVSHELLSQLELPSGL
jgi:hypothetical protein